MLTGTNLSYTKDYNFRTVYETVRLEGPISRADIARKTNLTAQTVSNIASRLLKNQFIQEGEKLQKKRGAPSTTLIVNPNGAFSIGLDLNRDHLTGILVDLSGNVRSKYFYEINSPTPDEAIDLMVTTVNQLLENLDINKSYFCGLGVGLPGPLEINKNDEIINTINPKAFPGWNHVPIGKLLKKHVDAQVYIENNASAATIGERWYGEGKNIPNFLYTLFGAGLGGGLVINGSLHEGLNRNAGELGFLPYINNKSPLSDSEQPHIGEHFNLTKLYSWLNEDDIIVKRPEDFVLLLNNQHPKFMSWLDKAVEYLAHAFLIVDYILDLEVIIFGGRLPLPIMEYFANELPPILKKNRVDSKNTSPTFQCSTAGIDAVALGAATLPIFNIFAAQADVLFKKS